MFLLADHCGTTVEINALTIKTVGCAETIQQPPTLFANSKKVYRENKINLNRSGKKLLIRIKGKTNQTSLFTVERWYHIM